MNWLMMALSGLGFDTISTCARTRTREVLLLHAASLWFGGAIVIVIVIVITITITIITTTTTITVPR